MVGSAYQHFAIAWVVDAGPKLPTRAALQNAPVCEATAAPLVGHKNLNEVRSILRPTRK